MGETLLKSALYYHSEGLCVIPCLPRDKRPALATWEEYQTRRSTEAEIATWFSNGNEFNIGAIHGEISGGYVLWDFDADRGLFDLFSTTFPALVAGRIVQSGSGQGYHIPLIVGRLPDFGHDTRLDRPIGNRTWKTDMGNLNCRARWCQSVLPPSLHPSGNRYHFLHKAPLVHTPDLDSVITWLNELAPPPPARLPSAPAGPIHPADGDLLSAVKAAWPTAVSVFAQFGMVHDSREEHGELRLLGNGGLLVRLDAPDTWYCFSDEVGGGVFEAWGWCRFGSAYDKRRQFRQVLVEMAQAAGIDVAAFYRKGDERAAGRPATGDAMWTKKYPQWQFR
jgi:hypothetical protein